ncbi:L,D-transpeptidase family protein [Rhizobium sp. LEGMi198b]|uniref:L,D-transpeptidase family protein n=1 Tax=unclassified Rhizobium TaxID=2613769 RepID=UPI000CDF338F|nr:MULTISPECIES: L,D-transpeptidase family protein [Rhizobium]AVA21134.1 L,D-transpeptidase domain-containing protein [Rhizobium sp. NXC24]MDK4739275.1 L,D-transpeptidase family protein [Rhizobium sp. CNPSo 3464]UWU22323.1 L,D-transpeptidase family protein [Rhizobium tropici]
MKSRFFFGLGLLSATALVHPAFAEDARTLQIVVSKDRQSLAVYDGDQVVATSKVSTGKRGHTTPSGIFSILEKEVYHESNLYSASPMPFMQRLTWSGIALHESNSVPNYPASHGCVRMPKAFAKMLYQMTERGVHVVIADQPLVPQPFQHAMLFQPEVAPAAALFSDLELRPTTTGFLPQAEPVQVATNDVAALPIPEAVRAVPTADQAPLGILITRRGLRENVRDLQGILNDMGFVTGTPDGMLGPATVQAIADFKKAHNITTSGGLVSPALMKAVYEVAGKGAPPNGEIMVRQNFKPLFEAPAIIAEPQEALGTHFFTAHTIDKVNGKADWFGVTLEDDLSKEAKKRFGITSEAQAESLDAADRALDRITIPDDVRRKIEDLLTAGSSLTISDTGIGPETGDGTDFITITNRGALGKNG